MSIVYPESVCNVWENRVGLDKVIFMTCVWSARIRAAAPQAALMAPHGRRVLAGDEPRSNAPTWKSSGRIWWDLLWLLKDFPFHDLSETRGTCVTPSTSAASSTGSAWSPGATSHQQRPGPRPGPCSGLCWTGTILNDECYHQPTTKLVKKYWKE